MSEKLTGGRARTFYLCLGPDCCRREQGVASFNHLERRLAELGLDRGQKAIQCRKTGCMNVCNEGPIGYFAPEGTWYRQMTPENLDRVLKEHLSSGQAVAELTFTPPPEAKSPTS
ncbi:hypothetical protein HYR69_08785 [Candidatus Sumerlaeota bacterium]|nr:hypothetical protein [Candidatus Sumerlaeota bacterium]